MSRKDLKNYIDSLIEDSYRNTPIKSFEITFQDSKGPSQFVQSDRSLKMKNLNPSKLDLCSKPHTIIKSQSVENFSKYVQEREQNQPIRIGRANKRAKCLKHSRKQQDKDCIICGGSLKEQPKPLMTKRSASVGSIYSVKNSYQLKENKNHANFFKSPNRKSLIHFRETPQHKQVDLCPRSSQTTEILKLKMGTSTNEHIRGKSEQIVKQQSETKSQASTEARGKKVQSPTDSDQILENLEDCSQIVNIMSQRILQLRSEINQNLKKYHQPVVQKSCEKRQPESALTQVSEKVSLTTTNGVPSSPLKEFEKKNYNHHGMYKINSSTEIQRGVKDIIQEEHPFEYQPMSYSRNLTDEFSRITLK